MKRKLVSLLLCAFALLLLMGAGIEQGSAAALASEEMEDSLVTGETSQITETDSDIDVQEDEEVLAEDAVQATAGTAIAAADVVAMDATVLVDGLPVSAEIQRTVTDGVSYVSLKHMALALDSTSQVTWDATTETVTVTTQALTLTAKWGQEYLVANGRYLYLPQGVEVVGGVTVVPMTVLCEAFDAQVSWDGATGITNITTGSGGILSGDEFYAEDAVFWLSRVVFAESGNQPLDGMMGVAQVVMNRVRSPLYPNTILEVLSQKNQFTTYKNGALADRTPNENSIIAAKLVLDGGEVDILATATHFDSSSGSWASRNLECLAVIGGHQFYG